MGLPRSDDRRRARDPRAGLAPGGAAITAAEARQLVINGLQVAFQTRGQIRIPTNSNAEISVAIVDLDGNLLAMARTTDAPVFGADVSVQKARSVVYFSRSGIGSAFNDVSNITTPPVTSSTLGLGGPYTGTFADYVNDVSLGDPTLFNSGIAFSDRAIGDLARPFYPDDGSQNGAPPGPLSLPFGNWSPFSTGLQLDLVIFDIATYGLGGTAPPTTRLCRGRRGRRREHPCGARRRGQCRLADERRCRVNDNRTPLANGLQIFAGAEPLYRGGVLVGAVGVSGDGIDQDDMISFLAIQNLDGLDAGSATRPRHPRRSDRFAGRRAAQLRHLSVRAVPR